MNQITPVQAGDWLALGGRAIAVTGAASGIGAAIAEALAEAGANVALIDRDSAKCDAVRDRLADRPGRRLSLSADVSDETRVKAAAAAAEAEFGPVTGLVNAAGMLRPGSLADVGADDWQTLMSVNLGGYLFCGRVFREQMARAGGGSIVHIGSISGKVPQPFSGAYSASKAAVANLSQQMAVEWGADGIRSNVIAPGMIRTELTEAYYQHADVLEAREGFTACRRIGRPRDIADAALFLLSDRSGYVNGSEIGVDGGLPSMLMAKLPRPGFTG
ncbi:SDR family NAD(P)-dependent oxidoreductase [Amaricoccus sp. W119]|uniref:SDR family NAD(P)-dependent oxidoreductase n=1 Tax=Amaricoccus sp. W119 TaxID=3391833 RepID=UPI0039A53120